MEKKKSIRHGTIPFRRKTQNTQEVQPFDLRGVERSFTTHEHVMNPGGTVLQKRNTEETASLSSEWVKVEDLRLRDQVLRSDGSWGTVTGIYYYNTEPTKVYNLEVEDNHTYVVVGIHSESVMSSTITLTKIKK
ncbi:intein C-terminal splicing domain protein [Leptospira kirschneri str. 200802841]|uniref:Intein C-terminal splicing domain protein n=1 Tax=Leptospira kirschneri str. 200802841 TaxID=1193047 RepID=A0A828Y7K2_9LEPT|nr:intein C-terminal splicing domain protein [Leptospira kirschneri]EKO50900.1 intein C-terminal splicing domain protein [Leptospira kirschneri str. 200802841]